MVLRRRRAGGQRCVLLLTCALLCAFFRYAAAGRDTWSVLDAGFTPEELASADAGGGGGGDPLIPLGPPEEQVQKSNLFGKKVSGSAS